MNPLRIPGLPFESLLSLGLTLVLTSTLLVGCGRYGRPLLPEATAPAKVQSLEVAVDDRGLELTWRSPLRDVRGKELKTLESYRVYRAPLLRPLEQARGEELLSAGENVRFVLVGTVADTSFVKLKEAKEEARAQGKPAHRVKIDKDLRTFSYRDDSLERGKAYLFQVIATNNDEVEGAPSGVARVWFRGLESEVAFLPAPRAASLQSSYDEESLAEQSASGDDSNE